MRARTRWLAAVTLAATMVGGCGSTTSGGPATSADTGAKAGGKPGPIAITVADSQPADKPSNLPLAEFKRQVETLSGGSMTVTILTGAVDDIAPNSDAAVIDKVKNGAFQMAVIPARAWSGAGVTSLKALQAPFMFESDGHVAAVVNDAAITTNLLGGFQGSRGDRPDSVPGIAPPSVQLRQTDADARRRERSEDPGRPVGRNHGSDRGPRRHGRRPDR